MIFEHTLVRRHLGLDAAHPDLVRRRGAGGAAARHPDGRVRAHQPADRADHGAAALHADLGVHPAARSCGSASASRRRSRSSSSASSSICCRSSSRRFAPCPRSWCRRRSRSARRALQVIRTVLVPAALPDIFDSLPRDERHLVDLRHPRRVRERAQRPRLHDPARRHAPEDRRRSSRESSSSASSACVTDALIRGAQRRALPLARDGAVMSDGTAR